MLDAMRTLRDELLEENAQEDAQLLERGMDVVSKRYTCFGCLDLPPACTWDIAWATFREGIG